MTQEELNELVLRNINSEATYDDENALHGDFQAQETPEILQNFDANQDDSDYRQTLKPDDHKIVHQLDSVTRDLEVRATQLLDQIDIISANAKSIQKDAANIKRYLESQKILFEKLAKQFPNIVVFRDSLKSCVGAIHTIIALNQKAAECMDCSLQIMDIMQYQDIHRQKIGHIANVMRTLAKYLNSMFSDIDDSEPATYAEDNTQSEVIDDAEL